MTLNFSIDVPGFLNGIYDFKNPKSNGVPYGRYASKYYLAENVMLNFTESNIICFFFIHFISVLFCNTKQLSIFGVQILKIIYFTRNNINAITKLPLQPFAHRDCRRVTAWNKTLSRGITENTGAQQQQQNIKLIVFLGCLLVIFHLLTIGIGLLKWTTDNRKIN